MSIVRKISNRKTLLYDVDAYRINTFPESLRMSIGISALGACRTYASRLDFCPSLQKQASYLLLPSRLRSLSPPSVAAFLRYRSALSTVCESIDSHTPLLRCQNTHVAQLRLSFCRLALGKNHQKSPRSLKVRQTPGSLSDFELLPSCIGKKSSKTALKS